MMNSSAVSSVQRAVAKEPTLPVLPLGLPALLTALRDEDISLDALAAAVRSFPSIAVRLIALANSSWISPKQPVVGLMDACALLGLRLVRSVSFALAVARPFDPSRCPGFNVGRYWYTALLTAEGAALLAPGLDDDCDPDTAYTAGLLHNLGLMWLADTWPTQTETAIQVVAVGEGFDLPQALYAATGNDYCMAGGRLCEAWELPEALTTAIRFHRTPEYRGPHWQFAAGCGLAAAMSATLWRGDEWNPQDFDDHPLSMSSSDMQAIFRQLESKRDSIRQLTQTLFGGG